MICKVDFVPTVKEIMPQQLSGPMTSLVTGASFQFLVHGIGIGPLMRNTFNYARDNSHHLHSLEASAVAIWLAQWSFSSNQPHRLFVPQ